MKAMVQVVLVVQVVQVVLVVLVVQVVLVVFVSRASEWTVKGPHSSGPPAVTCPEPHPGD